MKKLIKFRSVRVKNGITFQQGEIHSVNVMQMGIVGGFDTVNGNPEGELHYSALCEFDDGSIIPLEIGFDIDIISSNVTNPQTISCVIPSGFKNVYISVSNKICADTNSVANWDTLAIPLPKPSNGCVWKKIGRASCRERVLRVV